ncbi:hypothetical protein LJC06_01330 [Bacteroidales bacterium OttesenSCG-928-I14]|nr:hypothetical protein [Bacteroidales bacterium OttesenSCG-928-I14]
MPVMYLIQKRICKFGTERSEKYYVIAKRWERISYDYLIEEMVRRTGLTPSEARSAMDYLAEAIPRLMEINSSIDLGPLGRMIITIKSEGSESEEEASVHKVKDIRLNYIPNKEIRKKIRKLPLKKYPELSDEEKESIYKDTVHHSKNDAEEDAKIDTARKCLKEGLDIEMTARISGLTKEEVSEIE